MTDCIKPSTWNEVIAVLTYVSLPEGDTRSAGIVFVLIETNSWVILRTVPRPNYGAAPFFSPTSDSFHGWF